MTARQAYVKLISKVAGANVVKCYEYDSVYVFQLAPAAFVLANRKSTPFDVLMSVNRSTCEIRDFKPFYISADEYNRGREVPAPAYKG